MVADTTVRWHRRGRAWSDEEMRELITRLEGLWVSHFGWRGEVPLRGPEGQPVIFAS